MKRVLAVTLSACIATINASGEAFTDTPYDETWDRLLRIANIAYCRGINEFAVCASSYQPWDDRT